MSSLESTAVRERSTKPSKPTKPKTIKVSFTRKNGQAIEFHAYPKKKPAKLKPRK